MNQAQRAPTTVRPNRRDNTGGICLRAAGAALVFLAGCGPDPPTPYEQLRSAKAAFSAGDFGRAETLAARIVEHDKYGDDARSIAAESAFKAKRHVDALAHYRKLADLETDKKKRANARFYAAECLRALGRLAEAEQAYKQVLEEFPENDKTHERVGFLLALTGRKWASVAHYWRVARDGSANAPELVMLTDPDRPLAHADYIQDCAKKEPDDPLVLLGLAAIAIWEGDRPEAQWRLTAILADDPSRLAAQAMLGELLVKGSPEGFWQWHEALPPDAGENPDIWFVRGLWARRQNQLPIAARCFWEALRRMPIHRRATTQLGQVLSALDEPSAADFQQRSKQLTDLTGALDDVMRAKGRSDEPMRRVVGVLEPAGRIWETCAWALVARKTFPRAGWPGEVLGRNAKRLRDDLPLVVAEANLALRHDFSKFPDHTHLPRPEEESPAASPGRRSPEQSPDGTSEAIAFVERAGEMGLDFVYDNALDPSTKGGRMQESNGGGVAVLDYDQDGRPDLYFTQGGAWKPGQTEPTPTAEFHDCLYRHRGDTYAEVSRESGLGSLAFGQGCTAGDFDCDGFPDVRVANIGANQLYRNNGDGTFSDVTAAAGPSRADWTASTLIVDLNADGLPDIYDVNYLAGPNIYTMICDGHACSPGGFDGVPDRVLINNGDGSFRAFENPIPAQNAKGLGVLAAMIDDPRRPSLFIANDQVANFYIRCAGEKPGDLELREKAYLNGLAMNMDGLAMACMGIAADDIDGNGLLDFYVTNFYDESNTFYLQDSPGLYVDATNAAGLRAPSWDYVGWGTQFLDADLDGDSDLVVANGHVDDFRDVKEGYRMRPQCYENTGGQFVELTAAEAGEYFGKKFLGRGLARLDWNGDGRMEFVVSNINDRASLLMNEASAGQFLNLKLHATTTARDAIGTRVEVTAGGRSWTKQLTAGDGFHCRNQPVLQFGLGDAVQVDELRVTWPSGEVSRFQDVKADRTIILVEGRTWYVDKSADLAQAKEGASPGAE